MHLLILSMNEKQNLSVAFDVETRGIKTGSPQWWAIRYKYDMLAAGEVKVEELRQSAIRSILRMQDDIKKMQKSTFSHINNEGILRIGAAMTVLHDELKKHSLVETKLPSKT